MVVYGLLECADRVSACVGMRIVSVHADRLHAYVKAMRLMRAYTGFRYKVISWDVLRADDTHPSHVYILTAVETTVRADIQAIAGVYANESAAICQIPTPDDGFTTYMIYKMGVER